ncbi:MAG: tRNA pseudouridine(55) synthase TruB [Sutterellaceae bacterium]|nr:tRNA pseudouridine(55) synthase TruB [Sutterellaceae bacterium]
MPRGRRGNPVDGVLLLDKPEGMSSNHALQAARRLLNAAKAGHCGTLDPMATGLLPLAFGEATKFSSDLLGADKAYEAEAVLGIRTDTGDTTGEVLERHEPNVTAGEVKAAAAGLTGPILQVPPMYSALKRNGVPLYRLARNGETVEREPRQVTIHQFDILSVSGDRVRMSCVVSKGTYIRTLIEDLGKALGCGAAMSALRRTRVGKLGIGDAVTLGELEAADGDGRLRLLAPPDRLIQELPAVLLGPEEAARFRNGQRLDLRLASPGRARVYGPEKELLGTAVVSDRGVLSPERLTAYREA